MFDPASYEQGRADERAAANQAIRTADNQARAAMARAEELRDAAAMLAAKAHGRAVMVDALAAALAEVSPSHPRLGDLPGKRLSAVSIPNGPAIDVGNEANHLCFRTLKQQLATAPDPVQVLRSKW